MPHGEGDEVEIDSSILVAPFVVRNRKIWNCMDSFRRTRILSRQSTRQIQTLLILTPTILTGGLATADSASFFSIVGTSGVLSSSVGTVVLGNRRGLPASPSREPKIRSMFLMQYVLSPDSPARSAGLFFAKRILVRDERTVITLSVTHNFLLEICATPPRAVALQYSILHAGRTASCSSSSESHKFDFVRDGRIELPLTDWKSAVLPLN